MSSGHVDLRYLERRYIYIDTFVTKSNTVSFVHIPDGLIWPIILLIGWVASIAVVGFAVRRSSKTVGPNRVPFMALLAAGIFVAQMLNFPIGGGTSGHLVGAALATILLGFAPGVLVITVILVVQALLFGDGGITALGVNLLNMAVIGCAVSAFVLSLSPQRLRRLTLPAAAWLAVFVGSLACALELGFSYSASNGSFGIPMAIALPAMLGYHSVIGIGEAILTVGIVAYLKQVLPELAKEQPAGGF